MQQKTLDEVLERRMQAASPSSVSHIVGSNDKCIFKLLCIGKVALHSCLFLSQTGAGGGGGGAQPVVCGLRLASVQIKREAKPSRSPLTCFFAAAHQFLTHSCVIEQTPGMTACCTVWLCLQHLLLHCCLWTAAPRALARQVVLYSLSAAA